MTLLNFKTLPMDSVEIKQNHQQVKKVLIVKKTLTRGTMANVQCIKYACEDLGLKGLTRIFFVVTGKVMMLAILAEKKKKKKLNERCVLSSAQNKKETIYPYTW